jgi:5'(3')-deoxyribonucleotidase
MLCTNCSQPVHPVVAVDIDGTLGDYHRHFQTFAEQWLGYTDERYLIVGSYNGSQPYRNWFCAAYGVDVTTFRMIKLAYRQGGLKRTMPVFEHAEGMMRSLAKRAEVWVTTTRPHDRYDRVDPDTVHWLERNRIPYDGLLFDEHKMHELYRRIDPGRVVAVLDDEPGPLHNVVRGVPILLRTAYNLEAEWDGAAVDTLPGAWAAMDELLQQWEEENQHER